MVKLPANTPFVPFFIAHSYYPPPLRFSPLATRSISSPPLVLRALSFSLSLSSTFSPVSCANLLFIKAKAHPGRVSSFVAGGYARALISRGSCYSLLAAARSVQRGGSRVKTCPPPCIKYPAITVITVTVLCEIARLPHRGRLRGLRLGPRTRM